MSKLTSPEEFFGYQMGSDRKIARWETVVEYFNLLKDHSDKIKVTDMGPSTEGEPFLEVVISSPENLAKLENLRMINLKISDPRGLTEEEIKDLLSKAKVVVCQSMSLHASEIGGTQMSPELAHDLLSREDEETLRILENVIFVMVPCFNPDGLNMTVDWYNSTLGTEYEGVMMPWLYHKYAGHDNNRDAFQTTSRSPSMLPRSSSRNGFPRHTSTTTTWGAMVHGSTFRPTASPSGPQLTLWSTGSTHGTGLTRPTCLRRRARPG